MNIEDIKALVGQKVSVRPKDHPEFELISGTLERSVSIPYIPFIVRQNDRIFSFNEEVVKEKEMKDESITLFI